MHHSAVAIRPAQHLQLTCLRMTGDLGEKIMGQSLKAHRPEELRRKIEEFKNFLNLEEEVLKQIEKQPLIKQFSELKMMHHFAVLIAKNLGQKGPTIN
jgi:Glu-tRNA(Gln) amidotransferase subunit E-like FAD-binding protein